MTTPGSASEVILAVLKGAAGPLSVDEICQAVYGRLGDRERGVVYQNLHRLDVKGRLKKHAMKYELMP